MKCSLGVLISLKRSLVFPILLFSSISLHWSLRKAFLFLLLFFGTLHSDAYIFPFLLCFSLLFFSQLCGFNLQLVQVVGRFWVFFLNNTAPGLQLWFYSHFWMWIIHWGLLLRLSWRTWVCPYEGARYGESTASVIVALAASGTQRSWWLGQQDI